VFEMNPCCRNSYLQYAIALFGGGVVCNWNEVYEMWN